MNIYLNDEQQSAVKTVLGPLLIIAGAGTGKTTILTQKILYLLKNRKVSAEEILALTFTEKAAFEMLERVDKAMPLGYEEVQISTFHAFADTILKRFGIFVKFPVNYEIINDAEAYVFMSKHLYDLGVDKLAPVGNSKKYVTSILSLIARLQDEYILPEEFAKYVNSKQAVEEIGEDKIELYQELARIYPKYLKLKLKSGVFEFSDLLFNVLHIFESHPNILRRLQDQYKYILVDEYQDTNYSQNLLVLKLGKTAKHIAVVGDDDQSIYKFRGASLSNIKAFRKAFPKTKIVVINKNYRSRQDILDTAYRLIQHNNPNRLEISEKIKKQLVAARPEFTNLAESSINIVRAKNALEEGEFIAQKILELTGMGGKVKTSQPEFDAQGQAKLLIGKESKKYKYQDIAILVRSNSHKDEILYALQRYGIPYKLFGKQSLYSRTEISVLLSFLYLVSDISNDIHGFNLLSNKFWGFSPRELYNLRKIAREQHLSMFEFLEKVFAIKVGETAELSITYEEVDKLAFLSKKSIKILQKILLLINKATFDSLGKKSLVDIVQEFFVESGMLSFYEHQDTALADFQLKNIAKFLNIVKSFESLSENAGVVELLDYIDYSRSSGDIPNIDDDNIADFDGVTVSTVHSVKGLEFDVVFIASLVQGRFPHKQQHDKLPIPYSLIKDLDVNPDEKKAHIEEERRLFYVALTRAKEQLFLTSAQSYSERSISKMSPFISEAMEGIDSNNQIVEPALNVALYSSVKVNDDVSNLFLPDFVLSYSSYSTYDTCPKQFKYKYVWRLFGKPTEALALGSIIHNVLRDFYSYFLKREILLDGFDKLSLEYLLQLLELHWSSYGFISEYDERRAKKKAKKMLATFYKNFFDSQISLVAVEKSYTAKVKDFYLTAKIDRIDLLRSQGGKRHVAVYDYKTGKLHDRDLTKKGFYSNALQLYLYKIILDKVGFVVDEAYFIFLEDGVKVPADLSDKNLERGLIKFSEFYKKLKLGNFSARPSSFTCSYCPFREICEDAI